MSDLSERNNLMLLSIMSHNRCFITHGSRLNTGWTFPVTLMEAILSFIEYHQHQSVVPKGRFFTVNSGTKVAVFLGINMCGSFTLLSAPYSLSLSLSLSLASEQTLNYLKRSQGPQRRGERVDLANWALRTSPKFTTGIKYQFHQGFWPDQRS